MHPSSAAPFEVAGRGAPQPKQVAPAGRVDSWKRANGKRWWYVLERSVEKRSLSLRGWKGGEGVLREEGEGEEVVRLGEIGREEELQSAGGRGGGELCREAEQLSDVCGDQNIMSFCR
jgi:hypothetical protein